MYSIIAETQFFKGLKSSDLEVIFKGISHSVKSFSKGQTIAQRDDEVRNLSIVLEGSVKGEMVDFSGKILKIEEINAPQSIAHAFLFGEKNRFPVDVVALEDCKILFISKHDVLRLLQTNTTILTNYLDSIASRAQFLTSKLWFLSFRTIKEKVAHFLLNLAKSQSRTTLILPKSHQELAEFFGVTRPALARVLAEMQAEGIITVSRREVTIINRNRLVDMIN